MSFKEKCPVCGKIGYGWGNKCMCGLPLHFDMSYPVVINQYTYKGPKINRKAPRITDPSISDAEIFFSGREYEGGNN